MWKVYYGSSSYSSLTASGIVGLGGSLATQSRGGWTISGAGYKYIAFPSDSSFTFYNVDYKVMPIALAGVSDGYTHSIRDLNYSLMSVTNSYGVNTNY